MATPHGLSRRTREVIQTLMLEGLEVPVARMRLAHCASIRCRIHCTWRRWVGKKPSSLPWPIATRNALTKLGPTFVKVGQILSVRSDLIPQELADALHGLQSQVPSVDFASLRPMIESELGHSLDQEFLTFDETPLAAGSIAQVHRATMRDGSKVVVKAKRPGVDSQVLQDLDILVWLAESLEKRIPETRKYRPVVGAKELKRYTLKELDFKSEARVAEIIGEAFAGDPSVVVPKIYFATHNLIVMAYIEGVPLDDRRRLDELGIDQKRFVQIGLEAMLKQIFDIGLFHGDPHPGNLHVTKDGKLVFLDFGIFGHLNERIRQYGALVLFTVSKNDLELMTLFLLRMAQIGPEADLNGFRQAIEDIYRNWAESTIAEYGFGKLVFNMVAIGARHSIIFPPDLVLYTKAMVTIEGVAVSIAPELNLAEAAAPYFEKISKRIYSPAHLRKQFERSAPLWWDLLERLPFGLAQAVDEAVLSGIPQPSTSASPSTLALRRTTHIRLLFAVSLMISGSILWGLGSANLPSIVGSILVALGFVGGLIEAFFRSPS